MVLEWHSAKKNNKIIALVQNGYQQVFCLIESVWESFRNHTVFNFIKISSLNRVGIRFPLGCLIIQSHLALCPNQPITAPRVDDFHKSRLHYHHRSCLLLINGLISSAIISQTRPGK